MEKKKSGASTMVWIGILFAFIRMTLLFFTIEAPGSSLTAIVAGMIPLIGAYLAIDFSAVVKSTKNLPTGKFKLADKRKYLSMIFALALLTVEAMVVEVIQQYSLEAELTLLISALFGMMSIYVAGMKMNKIATEGKKEPPATD